MPSGARMEIEGPDLFDFGEDLVVKPGVFLTSDRGIVKYRQEAE